jgi:multidrug resistance efflux pump
LEQIWISWPTAWRKEYRLKTLEEQLASVQKAIENVESQGQEAEIEVNGNRRDIKRANARELYRREAQLKMAIKRRDGAGTYPMDRGV